MSFLDNPFAEDEQPMETPEFPFVGYDAEKRKADCVALAERLEALESHLAALASSQSAEKAAYIERNEALRASLFTQAEEMGQDASALSSMSSQHELSESARQIKDALTHARRRVREVTRRASASGTEADEAQQAERQERLRRRRLEHHPSSFNCTVVSECGQILATAQEVADADAQTAASLPVSLTNSLSSLFSSLPHLSAEETSLLTAVAAHTHDAFVRHATLSQAVRTASTVLQEEATIAEQLEDYAVRAARYAASASMADAPAHHSPQLHGGEAASLALGLEVVRLRRALALLPDGAKQTDGEPDADTMAASAAVRLWGLRETQSSLEETVEQLGREALCLRRLSASTGEEACQILWGDDSEDGKHKPDRSSLSRLNASLMHRLEWLEECQTCSTQLPSAVTTAEGEDPSEEPVGPAITVAETQVLQRVAQLQDGCLRALSLINYWLQRQASGAVLLMRVALRGGEAGVKEDTVELPVEPSPECELAELREEVMALLRSSIDSDGGETDAQSFAQLAERAAERHRKAPRWWAQTREMALRLVLQLCGEPARSLSTPLSLLPVDVPRPEVRLVVVKDEVDTAVGEELAASRQRYTELLAEVRRAFASRKEEAEKKLEWLSSQLFSRPLLQLYAVYQENAHYTAQIGALEAAVAQTQLAQGKLASVHAQVTEEERQVQALEMELDQVNRQLAQARAELTSLSKH